MMSQAATNASSIEASGGSKVCSGDRQIPDPLDLEGPQRVAGLVEPDEIERMGGERGLDVPGMDAGLPRLPARIVDGWVIGERHDAPLRPRLRELVDVVGERGVERPAGHHLEGPPDMLGEHRRQPAGELLEGGREVGVVFVGVADHQARREEDGHRLGSRELQGWQESLALDAPAATLAPHRDPDLALQRPQVAVDRPFRDADLAGNVLDPGAGVAAALEDANDTVEAGQAIAFAAVLVVVGRALPLVVRVGLVGPGHGSGATIDTGRSRSVAVRVTRRLPWSPARSRLAASPFTLAMICPT